MNEFQLKLYNDLMNLVKSNEAFYYQDFVFNVRTYRIFNYRLASYSDFLLPNALNARGTMFEVIEDEPLRLVSLPMEKFFNLNENPMTMNLDLNDVVEIQEKADGSLMSTYIHWDDSGKNLELRLKSKGSLWSDQAIAAMEWLEKIPEFRNRLFDLTMRGFTVNLEWCSPIHRIVLGYEDPELKVLNVRDNNGGQYNYHWKDDILGMYAVNNLYWDNIKDFDSMLESKTDMEGVVYRFMNGLRVKRKTPWYLSLHHAKDSVNNPRRLFEAILDEGIDDLRSMFSTDVVAMKMIDEMQVKVDHTYNHMVKTVEDFYVTNGHLDRKSYAIKGQEELDKMYFGPAMNKYLGKEMNYKEYLKARWKQLGLKDTSLEDV